MVGEVCNSPYPFTGVAFLQCNLKVGSREWGVREKPEKPSPYSFAFSGKRENPYPRSIGLITY
jgi:hypothetical protein